MAWFMIAGPELSAASSVVDDLRAAGLHEGAASAAAEPGVLVLANPAGDAYELVDQVRSEGRVLVALLGCADLDPWPLLQCGADEVVTLDRGRSVGGLLARLARWAAVDGLVEGDQVRSTAIGQARCWKAVLREIVEISSFTASPVLLTGETGTGKEVVAHLLHDLDPRTGELVLIDCTTVVPSLSGSEFFGHEKGAFTGATAVRAGAFELADKGTLFLDEVGELPAELQAALLRVVQERAFKKVGGSRWQGTNFRLVAATNRDLLAEQDAGRFRRDLYFRLAAATVRLPPLRDRIEDVVPLFRHFFGQASKDGLCPELHPAVTTLLKQREYPGNVRDLRQLALRVAARHVGPGPVTPGDVPPDDRPVYPRPPTTTESNETAEKPDSWSVELERAVRGALLAGVGLKELKARVPEMAVRIAREETDGPGAAAGMLGVSRRAVDYRTSRGS